MSSQFGRSVDGSAPEVLIIGAGLSGLAAAIRLAHFDYRVLVVERHTRVGGLNSWYRRAGRTLDTGLHAMTNYAPAGRRSAPLNRLLRQLRLRYEDLALVPQRRSEIRFPWGGLEFSNDFSEFQARVFQRFPGERAGCARFFEDVLAFDAYSLNPPRGGVRAVMARRFRDPRLRDLLLFPVMCYGSAAEADMEFAQYCMLFRGMFVEGLARPEHGMRPVLELLVQRLHGAGAALRLGCGVRKIRTDGGRCTAAVLDDGRVIRPRVVLSNAGYAETLALCDPRPPGLDAWPRSRISLVELAVDLDVAPSRLGFERSVLFEHGEGPFVFSCPETPVDERFSVLCAPGNFGSGTAPENGLRLSALANPAWWTGLDEAGYREAKARREERQLERLERLVPGVRGHIVFHDFFTPRTLARFTGRPGGALYGSPRKVRDGRTPFENLFICGADQGFLGITGALLSGVSIANAQVLRRRAAV